MEITNNECPICMETIDSNKNIIITDCGHKFHCKCMMENIRHNGFGCPYCRHKMINSIEDEEEEDEEKSRPHGICKKDESVSVSECNDLKKIEVWVEDIKGISYYIDKYKNVYKTEDIFGNKDNPEIIGKYEKTGSEYILELLSPPK
jgi:hypothetical protein